MKELTIALVGPKGSGKTAFATRVVRNAFVSDGESSTAVYEYTYRTTVDSESVMLTLKDIPGSMIDANDVKEHLRGVDAICFFVDSESTVSEYIKFYIKVSRSLGCESFADASKFLVFSKIDMSGVSSYDRPTKDTIEINVGYSFQNVYRISAKSGVGIPEMIQDLVRQPSQLTNRITGFGRNQPAEFKIVDHLKQLVRPASYKKTFFWVGSLVFSIALIFSATGVVFKKADSDLNKEGDAHKALHQLAGAVTLAASALLVFVVGFLSTKAFLYRRGVKARGRVRDDFTTPDADAFVEQRSVDVAGVGAGDDAGRESMPLLPQGPGLRASDGGDDLAGTGASGMVATTEVEATKRLAIPNRFGPRCCGDQPFFTPTRVGLLLTLLAMSVAAGAVAGKPGFPKMWSALVSSAWSHKVGDGIIALAAGAAAGGLATLFHVALVRQDFVKNPVDGCCGAASINDYI